MKSLFSLALVAILFNSCTEGQTNGTIIHLSATEFVEKIGEQPNASILDVRTPDEYSKEHLARSLNFDVSANEFEKQIVQLDKSKKLMPCLFCSYTKTTR